MDEILVSIIMPVFNAEKYIDKSLTCIINQTYNNIEVLCIDDGSIDKSADIIRSYVETDKRVRLIRQKNQYAGMARERGLKEAAGKYVMFLDADDYFSERLIENLLYEIEKNCADIAICDENAVDGETDQTIMFSTFSPLFNDLGEVHVFSPDEYSHYIFNLFETHVWDKMFRLEFVKENNIHFQNSKVINDALFCQLAMCCAKKIVVCHEKLVTYRIHMSNSVSSNRFAEWRCAYEMLDFLREGLEDRGTYKKYQQSYNNYAAAVIAEYLMCSITDAQYFSEAFNYYKEYAASIFEFAKHPKSYYYRPDIYDVISRLDNMNMIEFLCSRVLDLKKKEREILDLNLQILGWEEEFSKVTNNLKDIIESKRWRFPNLQLPYGTRIALYGYGDIGRDYSDELIRSSEYELVAVADKNAMELSCKEQAVLTMDELLKVDWDYILLALFSEEAAATVRVQLEDRGIAPEKIIWIKPTEVFRKRI